MGLASGLARLGVPRLTLAAYGGLGSIFMLHRVCPASVTPLFPHPFLSVPFLDELLSHVKRRGWTPIGMDELAAWRRPQKGRFAVFTLDDGYRDNLELALPVFEAHDVPFTVYACTGLVSRTASYWWGALQHWIEADDEILVNGATHRTRTQEEKARTYQQLAARARNEPDSFRPQLEDALAQHGWGDEAANADFLDWRELERLDRHPLATIGAHSETHRSLAALPEAEMRGELSKSKADLEAALGHAIKHVAYPYGGEAACGTREFAAAKELGFSTGVTTRIGNVFSAHEEHPTALPRIPVSGLLRRARDVDLYVSGLLSVLKGRVTRVQIEHT